MWEFPRECFRVWMILAHVSLQFLFRGPPDVHPCAAHFRAAEGFFVAVGVLS